MESPNGDGRSGVLSVFSSPLPPPLIPDFAQLCLRHDPSDQLGIIEWLSLQQLVSRILDHGQ
jgi:hypothetical protein